MRLKGLLVLLCIFVMIAALFYFYEVKGGKEREEKQEAEKKLYSFLPEDVTKVELINAENNITLAKENNTWKITSPVSTLSDEDTIKNLLEKISSITIDKEITIPANRISDFGLKPAIAIYKLYKGTNKIAELILGNNTPSNTNIYALETLKKKFYLLPSSLNSDLEINLFSLRNKRITNFKSEEVTAFNITAGKDKVVCEYLNNVWYVTYPKHALADNIKISAFLASVEYLKAESFDDAATDTAQHGLDKSSHSVSLKFRDKEKILEINFSLAKENELYVFTEDTSHIAQIASSFIQNLKTDWTYWRENKPILFNYLDVKRIVLNNKGKILEFSMNENEEWQIAKPAKAKADKQKINQLMWAFEQLDATDILDSVENKAEYGFESSNFWLTLYEEEETGKLTEKTIIIGKYDKKNKQVYVFNKQKNTIFVVPELILSVLNKEVNNFAAIEID